MRGVCAARLGDWPPLSDLSFLTLRFVPADNRYGGVRNAVFGRWFRPFPVDPDKPEGKKQVKMQSAKRKIKGENRGSLQSHCPLRCYPEPRRSISPCPSFRLRVVPVPSHCSSAFPIRHSSLVTHYCSSASLVTALPVTSFLFINIMETSI